MDGEKAMRENSQREIPMGNSPSMGKSQLGSDMGDKSCYHS